MIYYQDQDFIKKLVYLYSCTCFELTNTSQCEYRNPRIPMFIIQMKHESPKVKVFWMPLENTYMVYFFHRKEWKGIAVLDMVQN